MAGTTKEGVYVSPSLRVYEYVSDDGTTYWSFTRSDRLVSPQQRLVLQNRMGIPVINYANHLRQMAQEFLFGPEPEVEKPPVVGVE